MTIRPISVSPFCQGKRRGSEEDRGKLCRRPAGWGTSHPGIGRCKLHGGSTPTQVAGASLASARETAQLYAAPRTIHPLDGLMEEYYRTAGLVDSYEAMCAGLLPDQVVWGVQSIEDGEDGGSVERGESLSPPTRKTKSGASVNLWVKLFNEERDRWSGLGERILRLGLDSRRAEYSQSQVAALVAVLLNSELGLSNDQRRVAARLLRELDDGQRDGSREIEGSVVT